MLLWIISVSYTHLKVTNGETADTKPDTTALEKALEEAEALQEEQYTESTWAVLTVRIQDAKAVLALSLIHICKALITCYKIKYAVIIVSNHI